MNPPYVPVDARLPFGAFVSTSKPSKSDTVGPLGRFAWTDVRDNPGISSNSPRIRRRSPYLRLLSVERTAGFRCRIGEWAGMVWRQPACQLGPRGRQRPERAKSTAGFAPRVAVRTWN